MRILKKLLSAALGATIVAGFGSVVNADYTYRYHIDTLFPDPAFNEYVRQFDKNSDGYFTPDEIGNIKTLWIDDVDAENFIGLSRFNGLETVVFMNCCELEEISFSGHHFETVKFINCGGLRKVSCGQYQTYFEISSCPQLKSVDFSNADALETARFSETCKLEGTLCFPKSDNLKFIEIQSGQDQASKIRGIETNSKAKLEHVDIQASPIRYIEMPGIDLKTLKVLGVNSQGKLSSIVTSGALSQLLINNELPDHAGYYYHDANLLIDIK